MQVWTFAPLRLQARFHDFADHPLSSREHMMVCAEEAGTGSESGGARLCQ